MDGRSILGARKKNRENLQEFALRFMSGTLANTTTFNIQNIPTSTPKNLKEHDIHIKGTVTLELEGAIKHSIVVKHQS